MEKSTRLATVERASPGMLAYSTASHVIFDKMDYGDSLLLLYHNSDCHREIFTRLAKQSARVHHVSRDKSGKGSVLSRIDEGLLRRIKTELDTFLGGGGGLVLADWGNTDECPFLLSFLEELMQQCRSRAVLVNAFDASLLDAESVSRLIGLHRRTFLLQEGHSTAILPEVSHSWRHISPETVVLPRAILEKVLKCDLRFVVLLFLEKGEKSGHRILKDIAGVFRCTLSLNSVYPLLKRLEDEARIVMRRGKGNTLHCSLTCGGKEELRLLKGHYLNAMRHFSGLIASSGDAQPENEGKETQMNLSLFTANPETLNHRP